MQFITLAAFAASAAAGVVDTNSLTERDLKTIQTLLTNVGNQIVKLDTAVKSYNGGSPSAALSVADDVIDALTSGKSSVQSSSMLSLTDAANLQAPVDKLTSQGKSLVSDLEAKRSLVEKAGQCSAVRTKVNTVNSDGQALVKAVFAKVPAVAAPVASSLAAPLVSLLNKAADDFSTSNCKDSGSSSGGSSSSASASASASSTEAASATSETASATETSAVTSAAAVTPTTTPDVPASTTVSVPPNVTAAGAGALAPAAALAIAIAAMAL